MMKVFRFKKFDIIQSKEVFRIGTDAVLLGALVDVSDAKNILEIGVGTGVVSLMVAQRNSSAMINGIEINEKAYDLAKTNFTNSLFSDRLNVWKGDFTNFQFPVNVNFDLIISNPPYFDENPSCKDVIARQKVKLDFKQLIRNATKYLSPKGRLSLIIPSQFYHEIEFLSLENELYIIGKINIYGIEGGKVRRILLTFSKRQSSMKEEYFIIEKSPRVYSDAYLELTKGFHVFSNKK